jgi:phosphoglycerate kinase
LTFRTLRDAGDVRGKRVLLREDLNVPMKDGAVGDETRIVAALETLRWLRERGAKTIILSHLGRPDGKPDPKYSLRPVAARLGERLGTPVTFVDDCIGAAAVAASHAVADGGFVLFENVRFHAGEEANDPAFARELAKSGDLYVNDAFGTAHRAHASTVGVASNLPAYAGLLMEAELAALTKLTVNPVQPFVCAIGGAKVADKVGVFENLLTRVNAFVIGGGMANTFLAAQGIDVGTSLRDPDLGPAKSIIANAAKHNVALHLPTDAVVADSFGADDTAQTVALKDVGRRMILDIGPASAQAYAAVLRDAKTIVFNGPMGVYEKTPYQNGTRTVGQAIAEATRGGATSVVGGGDAAAAAHELGFADAMTHVSTGGGATLEFLEGKTLPGVAALER